MDYASFTLQALSGSHSDIHAALVSALDLQGLTMDAHEDVILTTYEAGTVRVSAYQQSLDDSSLVWTDFVVDTSLSNVNADELTRDLKALWTTPARLLIEQWRSCPDRSGFPANARRTIRTVRDSTIWWDYMSAPAHHFAGHVPPTSDPDVEPGVLDMEAITADQVVTEFLRPVGGGNKNIGTADGSVTPVVYEFGPPTTGKKAKDTYIAGS